MRSIFLILCAATAAFVLPSEKASAGHYADLDGVACEYSDAADLFHRSLGRCRRATDYSERLAQRLACAAGDLHDAIHVGDDPRRVAVLYDEVFVLHDRLSEILGSRCQRPDPIVLAYWRPLDAAFDKLVCAMEGCQTVCVHISNRRPAVVSTPVVVNRPVVLPPFFGTQVQIGPSFGGRDQHPGDRFDRHDFRHPTSAPRHGWETDNRDFRNRGLEGRDFQHQSFRDQDFNRGRDDRRRDDFGRADDPRHSTTRGNNPNDLRAAAVRSILSRILN